MKNEKLNSNLESKDYDTESIHSIEMKTRRSYEEILAPEAETPIITGKEQYIKVKKQKVIFQIIFYIEKLLSNFCILFLLML